jgi:hypothetical protein
MPHLEAVPGVDAFIKINGLNATEYINHDEPTDASYQVVRYIEAVPGAEYTIHGTLHETFQYQDYDVVFMFYVDGQMIRSIIGRKERFTHPPYKFLCEGAERDTKTGAEILNFKFASLVTSRA